MGVFPEKMLLAQTHGYYPAYSACCISWKRKNMKVPASIRLGLAAKRLRNQTTNNGEKGCKAGSLEGRPHGDRPVG